MATEGGSSPAKLQGGENTNKAGSSGTNRQLFSSLAGGNNPPPDLMKTIRAPKAYRPKIDGDFKDWVRHLEHYFTLLNIDPQRRTTMLLYYLGDEASKAAFHLNLDDNTRYEDAKAELMQYFSPVETPEELRAKFHQRYQNSDESLEHFAMEIRVLCSKAYPDMRENDLDNMAKQQFALGVRNAITRERLIVKRPERLKDAIEYARLSEVAGRTAKLSAPSNQKNIVASVQGTNGRGSNDRKGLGAQNFQANQRYNNFQNKQVYNWRPGNSNTQGRDQRICYSCGKPGHIAKNCYSRNSQQQTPRSQINRGLPFNKTIKTDKSQANVIIEEESLDEGSNASAAVFAATGNHKGILAVTGIVGGKTIESLIIDTGSAVSLMSSKLWKQFSDQSRLKRVRTSYVVANGTQLHVDGSTEVRVQLGGVDVKHEFMIVPTEVADILLGCDFLTKHKCDILTSLNSIVLGNVTVPTHMKTTKTPINIIAVEDVSINGMSEHLVAAQLEECEAHMINQETCLVEGDTNFENKTGVLIARSLVNPSAKILVRVINPSSWSSNIHKGNRIGELIEIEPDIGEPVFGIKESSIPELQKENILKSIKNSESILNVTEMSRLIDVLCKHASVISQGPTDLGRCEAIEHKIYTADASPIRMAPRRIPYHQQEEVQNEIESKLSAGLVRKSNSPWAFPIVVVRKKDGSARICVDYRKLNDVTKKDAHPLPRIEDIFDALRGSKYFSTIDLASGYHQVSVARKDQEKTAFVTPWGHYEYVVMPFGLCNAPATFQRLMTLIFSGLIGLDCLIYLDDIIIFGPTFDVHLLRLEKVLMRLQENNLKIKLEKCHFGLPYVSFLGHVVSAAGIHTDPSKIDVIQKWILPSNISELRSFLGLASYYRRFIQDFAKIVSPLTLMLEKDRAFIWTDEGRAAFENIKKRLCNPPILTYPDFNKPFILDTDVSDQGIGAVLSQQDVDGQEHPIAYYSRGINKHEKNYSITRKELLAAIDSAEHFRCYLYGRKFLLRTDHAAIQWLKNFKEPTGQLARWLERLTTYDFTIQHRPGKKHANADGLSRHDSSQPVLTLINNDKDDNDNLSTAQQDDTFIRQLIQWVKEGQRPSLDEQPTLSHEQRTLWARFEELGMIDNKLCLIGEVDGCVKALIIVPVGIRIQLIRDYHEKLGGGHFATEKTVEKLKSRFYWPGLKRDTQLYCATCSRCAARKAVNITQKGKLNSMCSGFPFERIAMDIVGPLPKTERGNQYMLVIIDYYTRWPEAFALQHQDAHSIASKLVTEYFSRYGAPYIIHTDQGANFESKLVGEICKLYDIKKTRTTPYHPQGDGLVERLNRTLVDTIALISIDAKDNWDLRIGLALMAIRSAVQSSIGYSPYFLLFGREMRLPADLVYDVPHEQYSSSVEAVSTLRSTIQSVHATVISNMESSHKRQKDCYDRRSHGLRYSIGDTVWLVNKNPTLLVNKFHDRWVGPYIIIKRCSDLVYEIKNPTTGKSKRVHYNLLKPATKMPHDNPNEEQENNISDPSESESDEVIIDPISHDQDSTPLNTADEKEHLTGPKDKQQINADSQTAISQASTSSLSNADSTATSGPNETRAATSRYNLRPRPKPTVRMKDAFLVFIALILLLPFVAASNGGVSPLVGVARSGQTTFNSWTKLGGFLTWASVVIPLTLAIASIIHYFVKWLRKLAVKCKPVSLTTPSKTMDSAGRAYEVCGCGRIEAKDPHLTIRPPLEVSQVVNDVNCSQRHVHSDGVTIVCLHPKCRALLLPATALMIIALLAPGAVGEILVPRMQIRAERSKWNAIRLVAKAPTRVLTSNNLWLKGRVGRIVDIRLAPARECPIAASSENDTAYTPLLSTLERVPMQIQCGQEKTIELVGTLVQDRSVIFAKRSPLPCLRQQPNEGERELIEQCYNADIGARVVRVISQEENETMWCINGEVTPATHARAVRDNAIMRPRCSEMEVEWVWWDGKRTFSFLSNDTDVATHLNSQQLEVARELNDCLTDHCLAVGNSFPFRNTGDQISSKTRKVRDTSNLERDRWGADRETYCPYETKNRPAYKIGDSRYDGGYTCEDYMDEWIVTWNSYATFAGDVVDWQNRTSHDVLELYRLVNTTADVVEVLRTRAVEFARQLHTAEVLRTRQIHTLTTEMRIGFSIGEQRSSLSNALTTVLNNALLEAAAWRRFSQWHTAASQCAKGKCEQLNNLIQVDGGMASSLDERQPTPIVEKWHTSEVAVVAFEAEYNSSTEVLTLCSIPYSLRRGCDHGRCQECLEQEAWCANGRIERNVVIISELQAAPCNGNSDTGGWVLLPTAEDALLPDGRYAGCLNVTFDGVFPLPWSTCFGTTRVAQWLNPLPTRYVPQERRSLVLISAAPTWSLPNWATGNDELSHTLREIQQRANTKAEAVTEWISEQVSARRPGGYESQTGIVGKINGVARGAHPMAVIALSCALVALTVSGLTLLTAHPVLKMIFATCSAALRRAPILCAYPAQPSTNNEKQTISGLRVVSAWEGGHKRIEYRARLARANTLEPLDTRVEVILHTSGKARLDYGPQRITEFVYGIHRRELLLVDIVLGSTSECKCLLNDDIEIGMTNVWPTAPPRHSSEQGTSSDNGTSAGGDRILPSLYWTRLLVILKDRK